MKKYAKHINAEYLFEDNPRFVTNLGGYSPHYGAFKPIYDSKFHNYDNVLFADTDIFAVDNLKENIFENFNHDIGICTEPDQPKLRIKTAGQINTVRDEQWAKIIKDKWHVEMPRTLEGLLTVYNTGVVLYSNKGLMKAKKSFIPFKEYVTLIKSTNLVPFYTCDQPYLHAMLKVINMDYIELDNGWNSYIHYTKQLNPDTTIRRQINDTRTANTKFVHIQIAGADHYNADILNRITNLRMDKWNI